MKCELDYCIYNREHQCILDETEINSMGMCDMCIVVSLDKANLEQMKERQLRMIEKRRDEM